VKSGRKNAIGAAGPQLCHHPVNCEVPEIAPAWSDALDEERLIRICGGNFVIGGQKEK
jgi:hypothetical protein